MNFIPVGYIIEAYEGHELVGYVEKRDKKLYISEFSEATVCDDRKYMEELADFMSTKNPEIDFEIGYV